MLLLDSLIQLRNQILGEMEQGSGGGLLGVEVQLRSADVGEFEFPQQFVLLLVKLEFPHLECHLNYLSN